MCIKYLYIKLYNAQCTWPATSKSTLLVALGFYYKSNGEFDGYAIELGSIQNFKTVWYFIKYHGINNYHGI